MKESLILSVFAMATNRQSNCVSAMRGSNNLTLTSNYLRVPTQNMRVILASNARGISVCSYQFRSIQAIGNTGG